MIYILNIETATKNCSVSLSRDGQLVAIREESEQGYSHAEKLHVFIEEVLAEAKITLQDLKAIAVGKGPGSYTGLRIGVSAAKGLCYSLEIPLIAIDTLKMLACQAKISDGVIIPLLDARRMEAYSAVFNSEYNNIRATQAQIIDETSFSDYTSKVYFLGDGAEKIKTVINHQNAVYLDDCVFPSSKEMVGLSYDAYINQCFEDVAYFEPFYLKDFLVQTKKK